jgi:hypothetical protein
MFNRRELLLGSMLAAVIAPLIADEPEASQLESASTTAWLEQAGFVEYESIGPLSLTTLNYLRWGRGGRLFAFSADFTRVVTVEKHDDRAYLWDSEAGTKLHTFQPIPIQWESVSFNADGTHVVIGSDGDVPRIYDASTGEAVLGT